ATGVLSEGLPRLDGSGTFQKFGVTAAKAALGHASSAAQPALSSIKITYSASTGATTRLQWFQDQWKKNLNVNITLDPVDSTTYTALVNELVRKAPGFYLGWCPDYYDQQDSLSAVFKSNSSVTHVGWKNDQFDKLV